MNIFSIDGQWHFNLDAEIPTSFNLNLSSYGMVDTISSIDFDKGMFYYKNNCIIINLQNNTGNNTILFFGMVSSNGQLEGIFSNISRKFMGRWAAAKGGTPQLSGFNSSGMENYSLANFNFSDQHSPSLYLATYTFDYKNSQGNMGEVELKIRNTNMSMRGIFFTSKFGKDGKQLVGMCFPSFDSYMSGISLGGVIEDFDGQLVINGLKLETEENNNNSTWSAVQSY